MTSNEKIRILLVEDQTLLREALARTLAGEPDFEIAGHCDRVDEAIQLVGQSRVDIVLLDINLGTDQGGAFISRARSAGFLGKILVVTAGIGEREAAWLLSRGCAGIFLKDQQPTILCERIREIVSGTGTMDETSVRALLSQMGAAEMPPRPLTPREREVLRCVCKGLTNKEIAALLAVSENTVKSFLQQLFSKLGVRTRSRLVALAIEQYWDDLAEA